MKQQGSNHVKLAQKLLSRVFEERIDKATVDNLKLILTQMIEEKNPLTRQQIMRRTASASSIVYPLVKKLEQKGYVEEKGKAKSERGPVPEIPLYSLTLNGQILAGVLLNSPLLVSRALDSLPKQDNPIWKFSMSILKEATDSTIYRVLMGETILRRLLDDLARGAFDAEAFGRTMLMEFNTHMARKIKSEENSEAKEMQTLFEKKYAELTEKEQRIVFQYMKFNIESMFLNKLTGEVLAEYLEATRNGDSIHVFCPNCRKIIRCGCFPNIDTNHQCS